MLPRDLEPYERTRRRPIWCILPAVCASLTLSACGSSAQKPLSSPHAQSKPKYAQVLCATTPAASSTVLRNARGHTLRLRQAKSAAIITPVAFKRLPFVVDHFNKSVLRGNSIFVITYHVKVTGAASLVLAAQVNSILQLEEPDGTRFQSLDAKSAPKACTAASVSYAAASHIGAYPRTPLSPGHGGESAVLFVAPTRPGIYMLVDPQTGAQVKLPRAEL